MFCWDTVMATIFTIDTSQKIEFKSPDIVKYIDVTLTQCAYQCDVRENCSAGHYHTVSRTCELDESGSYCHDTKAAAGVDVIRTGQCLINNSNMTSFKRFESKPVVNIIYTYTYCNLWRHRQIITIFYQFLHIRIEIIHGSHMYILFLPRVGLYVTRFYPKHWSQNRKRTQTKV